MKHIFSVLMSIMAGAFISAATAQTVRLPYQMDFEEADSVELSNWVLNSGPAAANCEDQWVVGKALHSAGRQSLYISNNNGTDAQFGSHPNVQYAYRDFVLPAGRYDLTFDWLCLGGATSSLYVGWAEVSELPTLNARATSGVLPNTIKARMCPNFSDMKNAEMWQHADTTIQTAGATMRLVFAWVSRNADSTLSTIGACIDNIVLTSTNCKRPYDIDGEVISCDSVLVTWSGTSGSYEFAYRNVESDAWYTRRNIPGSGTKGQIYLSNMYEGSYDFRVRGICTPDTSAWAYYSGFVVFCPETHCVNFTDLYAPEVTCTYSPTRCFDGYSTHKDCAYANVGVIDFGPDAKQSRHTVNWDRQATDPRTGDQLLLVPKDGYASVRLGNWNDDGEAEAISYQFPVDEDHSILMMKYAVVLQDPDHGDDDQPRFVLEILDENGASVDPTCGSCNFSADKNRQGWHTAGSGYDLVTWKDWTTIGLNLTPYIGQVLTVRLSTYDCAAWGHYGYAYFALDCANAVIKTAACAKDPNPNMQLIAPQGFTYQWYRADGTIIPGATTREFWPSDTLEYECVLTNKENPDCRFSLRSKSIPRLPYPDFTPKFAANDCRNVVQMENHSYVKIVESDSVINLYDEKCDTYYWETWGTYADGTPFLTINSDNESPIFEYPSEGGDFFVKLTATVAGSCVEDTMMTLHLDSLRSYLLKRDTVLCRPSTATDFRLWLDGLMITESGVYTIPYKTGAGCDSIIQWNVTINSSYDVQLPDTTLCYGESLTIGNLTIDSRTTASGMWGDWDYKSSAGCDSVLRRRVTVLDSIQPQITSADSMLHFPYQRIELNPGQTTVDLGFVGSGYSSYTVEYVDAGVRKKDTYAAFDSLKALPINEYYLKFYNAFGCESAYDTILVGGDTLCISFAENGQLQCNCGTPIAWFPYHKCLPENKARVTRCDVKFEAAGLAQGFKDTAFLLTKTSDTLRIAIPSGAEPGLYTASFTFDTIIGGRIWGQNAFTADLILTYDSALIYHRWTYDAVLSVKNASYARKQDGTPYALYDFSDFQWYRNDLAIEGANLSYMEQPGTLDMAAEYRVEMTRADGQRFRSCSYVPSKAPALAPAQRNASGVEDVHVSPTMPMASAPISVSLPDEAQVSILSILGTKVADYNLPAGENTILAPSASGIYIMNVRMRGETTTIRLQVK